MSQGLAGPRAGRGVSYEERRRAGFTTGRVSAHGRGSRLLRDTRSRSGLFLPSLRTTGTADPICQPPGNHTWCRTRPRLAERVPGQSQPLTGDRTVQSKTDSAGHPLETQNPSRVWKVYTNLVLLSHLLTLMTRNPQSHYTV